MSKNKDKIRVSFVGLNASEVTGSMILVEYKNKKLLLDAGLYQSAGSKLTDYKINSRKLEFNPKEIDYILISHINIDHFGLIPRLVKEGCEAPIITYHDNVEFMYPMLEDSAFILDKDLLSLQRKNPNLKPIFDIDDVRKTMQYIRGYDKEKIHILDDTFSFELIPAQHIIGSMQIVLYIKEESGHIEKLGFSGDIGNILFDNPFVDEFKPITKSSIFIGESTYSNPDRSAKKKDRDKDIEKIKSIIDSVCVDRKSRVLFPCFALQRIQTILKLIYDIYGNDESFNIPVIIDSPLAVKITRIFVQTLTGEDKIIMDKIMSWKNLKLIEEAEDSRSCVEDMKPKIILSSSGMLTAGRSIHYLKSFLPRGNDCIVTCGFMVEGSLGWKIKNGDEQKTITIDGKAYRNKCQVLNLKSMSSHMQFEQLLNYYKGINTNAIYLVHGNMKDKIAFKKILEEEFAKMGKTTKVVAVNKSTKISL